MVLNWVFNVTARTDGDQNLAVTTLGNSVINHVIGKQSPDAVATITVGAESVGNILLGNSTAQAEIDAGRLTIDGDVLAVLEFFSLMEGFPSNFNIVTP
ncbi:MAG: alkyl sulfatase C-terminal domain-containing protein [Caldilineaceae bacterium]